MDRQTDGYRERWIDGWIDGCWLTSSLHSLSLSLFEKSYVNTTTAKHTSKKNCERCEHGKRRKCMLCCCNRIIYGTFLVFLFFLSLSSSQKLGSTFLHFYHEGILTLTYIIDYITHTSWAGWHTHTHSHYFLKRGNIIAIMTIMIMTMMTMLVMIMIIIKLIHKQ